MLTYDQQRAIISKYTVSRHNNKNTTGTGYAYVCRYHCKYCETKNTPKDANTANTPHLIEVANTRLWPIFISHHHKDDAYLNETLAQIQTLADHLEKQHEVSPCKICGDMITRRGMKRHQQAPACTSELRRYTMREKGFQQLPFRIAEMIPNYIRFRRNKLETMVPWDDENAINLVAAEAVKAESYYTSSLGIKTCLTMWDPKEKEYKKEYWAPPNVARMLELQDEVTPWRAKIEEKVEPLMNVISQWLDGDDETQDAIVGLLELQKEGLTNS